MIITKEKKRSFLLSIYYFLSIFLPDLLSIPMQYIILGINIIVCVYYMVICKKNIIDRSLFIVFACFFPFILYAFGSCIVHMIMEFSNYEAYASNLRGNVNIAVYVVLTCIVTNLICKYCNYTYEDIVDFMLNAAVVQMILVIGAYVIPGLKQLFNLLTINNSTDSAIVNAIKNYPNRSYGLANNLFDSFGYIISFLISFAFLKGVSEKNTKWYILSLIFLFMPLVNSRTGLLLSAMGMVVVLIYYFDIHKLAKYIIIAITITCVVVPFVSHYSAFTIAWIKREILESIEFFKGNTSVSVFNQLLVVDIVWPRNIIFGVGGTPELLNGISGIDSGYIQAIWRYGVFGLVLLFIGNFVMCGYVYLYSKRKKNVKCIMQIIMIIFVFYMFKLFSLTNYGSITIIFSIVTAICTNKNNLKKMNGVVYYDS